MWKAIVSLLVPLAGLALSPSVSAQEHMVMFNDSIDLSRSYVAGAAMASVANHNARRVAGKKGGPIARPPAQRGKAAASLAFGNDPAIARKARTRFRDNIARSGPRAAAAIDIALRQDWMRGYASDIARPNGLDPRNLADSHAAYFIASWALVNGVTTISPRAVAAVRDRVRADMAADPRVVALSPAQRQEMGEDLNYNSVLVMANREHLYKTRDARLEAAAARHYGAQFTKLGIDLKGLRLTDKGFVPR